MRSEFYKNHLKEYLVFQQKLVRAFAVFLMAFFPFSILGFLNYCIDKVHMNYSAVKFNFFEIIGTVGIMIFCYFVPFRFGNYLRKVCNNRIDGILNGLYIYKRISNIESSIGYGKNGSYIRYKYIFDDGGYVFSSIDLEGQGICVGDSIRVFKYIDHDKETLVFAHF